MTISISLSKELEEKLKERAAAAGKDAETFAREALEEKLALPQTFAELLAPIREETQRLGTTEEELESLIEEVRDEVFAEKQGRKVL